MIYAAIHPMSCIELTVNGQPIRADGIAPTTTLLNYLRDHLGLCGTKEGCAEGDCGACTVGVLDPDAPGGPGYRAVNACLVLLPMMQGQSIVTVEGLKDGDTHHPVQDALVTELGSQCGYCTPGVIMSMFEACYRRDLDEPWKLDDQMCGNLCRCTGYRPIRDATKQIAALRPDDRFAAALSQASRQSTALIYEHEHQRWFAPDSFEDLFAFLDRHPDARFVAGGTDLSLEVTKRFAEPELLVSLDAIDALRVSRIDGDVWRIGATVDLATIEAEAKDRIPAIERMLRFFGARQIKNRGTIGGNICNASPIGDLPPILLALGAKAVLRSPGGVRRVAFDDFFIGYRKTALHNKEILEAVEVPLPPADAKVMAYKVSKRQELDISAVAAGLYLRTDAAGTVTEARFGYGGMAATPARAKTAEAAVIGEPWTEATAERAAEAIADDFTPIDDHRASAWYRATVAANLLRGFWLETQSTPSPRLPHRPTGTVEAS